MSCAQRLWPPGAAQEPAPAETSPGPGLGLAFRSPIPTPGPRVTGGCPLAAAAPRGSAEPPSGWAEPREPSLPRPYSGVPSPEGFQNASASSLASSPTHREVMREPPGLRSSRPGPHPGSRAQPRCWGHARAAPRAATCCPSLPLASPIPRGATPRGQAEPRSTSSAVKLPRVQETAAEGPRCPFQPLARFPAQAGPAGRAPCSSSTGTGRLPLAPRVLPHSHEVSSEKPSWETPVTAQRELVRNGRTP